MSKDTGLAINTIGREEVSTDMSVPCGMGRRCIRRKTTVICASFIIALLLFVQLTVMGYFMYAFQSEDGVRSRPDQHLEVSFEMGRETDFIVPTIECLT